MIQKKLLITCFIIASVFAVRAQQVWTGTVATEYAGGNGSSEYPFLIANGEQLAKLAKDVNTGTNWSEGKCFKLIADIALNQNVINASYALDTLGKKVKSWDGIGIFNSDLDYKAFMGVFDGDGHVIKGIYHNDYTMSYVGLFRYVERATIKNLGVVESYIYSNANVAAIAGIAKNSTVINCYNMGRVDGNGSYHGGIVGNTVGKSVVANCYNYGVIGGKNNIGGIVGRNGISADGAMVINCHNYGAITATKTNKGGIVAENNVGSFVRNCYFINTTATGVYYGSGTYRNVVAKTKADYQSGTIQTLLNDTSKIIPLACRWVLKDTMLTHNYVDFTKDTTGTVDVSKMANGPIPANGERHADGDNGTVLLQWKPAINGRTVKQYLYFSADSTKLDALKTTDIAQCTATLTVKDTSYVAKDIYSMQTYYWRVDQQDSANLVIKGKIWSFHPRHLAFRGAEGYGRFASGGRGGKVVYVTNLNVAGAGSFREAVTANIGPRTVVFNVSGIIALSSRLVMSPNVTVAGQTAPGKGICFRTAPIGISSEGICRFVRMRLGAGTTYDGMGMAGVNNAIMDHSSISWTIDESFSSRYAKNITLQRTLISEALNVAGHQNYPAGTAHGYAGSVSGDIGSLHHNLLAHNEGRNWSMAGGLDGNGYYTGKLDIFNMVVYNWGGRATDGGVYQGNFVNNYYKEGPATTKHVTMNAQLENVGKGTQSYYYAGNILQKADGTFTCNGTDNTCGRIYTLSNGQVLDWTVFTDKPYFPSYAKIESAKDAYKSVLSDVGCNLPLDDHDKRIIRETLTGTYTYKGSVSGKPGLIDHQDDQGGYENYPAETRPADFDTDRDGLPNWWETLYGSNPNSTVGDFSDANADPDKDGYTALEDYLEWMAVPHYFIPENTKKSVSLASLVAGYKTPTFSTANSKNMTVVYKDTVADITPTGKGINYLEVKITDAEGSTTTRVIGVCTGTDPLNTAVNQPVSRTDRQFYVYPSLFDAQLTVQTESATTEDIDLMLVDLMGKEVLRKNCTLQTGYNTLKLDCPANLPSQVYLLKAISKNGTNVYGVRRVVKK